MCRMLLKIWEKRIVERQKTINQVRSQTKEAWNGRYEYMGAGVQTPSCVVILVVLAVLVLAVVLVVLVRGGGVVVVVGVGLDPPAVAFMRLFRGVCI